MLRLASWTGGTGTPPVSNLYIGTNGFVSDISLAIDIRGAQGLQGIQGIQGIAGADGTNGVDGKTVTNVEFLSDLSVKLTYNDATTVTSNPPPKQYGWGSYKDGQYSDVSPLVVAAGTQIVVPNNANTKIEPNLPTGVTTFFDVVNNKYLMTDSVGFYTARIRFKVAPSNQADYINISMSKGTVELVHSEDRTIRGDNTIHEFNFSTVVYGDSSLATNGLQIRLKTNARPVSVYNIEVTISKLI